MAMLQHHRVIELKATGIVSAQMISQLNRGAERKLLQKEISR